MVTYVLLTFYMDYMFPWILGLYDQIVFKTCQLYQEIDQYIMNLISNIFRHCFIKFGSTIEINSFFLKCIENRYHS